MTGDKALKLGFLLQATDNMSRTLEKAGENLTGFQKKLAENGANAARIGGHFMVLGNQIGGGMLNIVKAAGEYANMSVTNATKVGMQINEWQKLAYAADMAGVSQEKLTSGMAKFNKTLEQAAEGGGTTFFKDFGIQLKDAKGKMRAHQDILKDVADVFKRTENTGTKSLLSQELFGQGGTDFIKMLNTGSSGLEEMGKKAEDLGLANEKNTRASQDFTEALRKVGSAVLSLKVSIGGALAPILTWFANALKSAIEWVSSLAQKCPALTKVIGGAVAVVGALLFAFGAIQVAIGAFATVMAKCTKIIRFAQSTMLFFKAVINGTKGATYAAMLTQKQFTIATKLHAVWQGIVTAAQWVWNGAIIAGQAVLAFFTSGIILTGIKIGALAVWQGIATAAQWLFNTSLYGCPIVWIIAGIMAVIAVVVLMVKYWDNIVAFFKGLWDGIKNIFIAAWEWIKNLFLKYHPIAILINNWSKIKEWFSGLWNGVKNVFVNAWNSITGWFSSLPGKFVEFGRNIIKGLINGITGMLSKLWDTIKNIGKGVGRFFSKILGINSPSTVFAKYGMNITQGLTVGIGRGEDSVEHATGSMAEQAINGYEQALQVQTVQAGNVVGGGSGMSGSFNYSPTINIGAGVSEGTKQDFAGLLREHYKEIMDIIQRSMENKTRLSYNS
jgi:hypothetical protein